MVVPEADLGLSGRLVHSAVPSPYLSKQHDVFTLLIYTHMAFYIRGMGEEDGGGVENGLEPESYN